jgi:hypothetical protein
MLSLSTFGYSFSFITLILFIHGVTWRKHLICYLNLSLLLFFFCPGDGTQGMVHASQVIYHWVTLSTLVLCFCWLNSHTIFFILPNSVQTWCVDLGTVGWFYFNIILSYLINLKWKHTHICLIYNTYSWKVETFSLITWLPRELQQNSLLIEFILFSYLWYNLIISDYNTCLWHLHLGENNLL